MKSITTQQDAVTKFALLKQAVIGISDGVMIPFVVTTSFSVLAASNSGVWTAGLITVIVGAFFMGLAGYFAARNRQENFSEKTKEEEERLKQEELSKTLDLFKKLELGEDMQAQAAVEIEKDTKEWNAYLDEHLSELEIGEPASLPLTAGIIAASFVVGGAIPLIPYFLTNDRSTALLISVVASLTALLLFGFIKSKVNKEPLFWGAVRMMLLGAFAAAAGFAVAKIFLN